MLSTAVKDAAGKVSSHSFVFTKHPRSPSVVITILMPYPNRVSALDSSDGESGHSTLSSSSLGMIISTQESNSSGKWSQAEGFNTLHVLPVNTPGKKKAMGTAGSVYSPKDLLQIDPNLIDHNDPRSDKEQFKAFIDECHKRGIRVMLDLPSCASYEMFLNMPELMAMEKDGLNFREAALQAAKLRFRAVMMTNIAFILGLLPLVFAKGAGAGSRHSIGVSVFGGMIAVAFIGSILVPAFFVLTNLMKQKTGELVTKLRNRKK